MLIDEMNAAERARVCGIVWGRSPPPMTHKPPAAVMPEIAFVTDMSGECRAGVTPHTVW